MNDFLVLSFVFLVAGVLAVPVASWLGLGSVLGYLIAGIVISPLLTALQVDVISLQHFAEFGVVMMLFLVGLELEPSKLWAMKGRLLGLGGSQVVLSASAIAGVALLLGQSLQISIAIGLILALSSTAIVLQSLSEKGLMHSEGGQNAFSVLLFQDIAVIPMLALMPLLAVSGFQEVGALVADGVGHDSGHAPSAADAVMGMTGELSAWARALVTAGAVLLVVVAGHYLTRPVFRYIAMAQLRELFTATALLFVVGIALLMTFVGVSPALGTFIAGVVLATSDYRHELESNINPFKGLLLGLFFMTVGASIDFALLAEQAVPIVAMTLGLIAIKALVLLSISIVFRIQGSHRWLFALSLAQAGEFGFVLLSFSVSNSIIPPSVADSLLLVVALSMLLTPLLFILFDRVIAPRFATAQAQAADTIDKRGRVIIAGHGAFGGVVNRILRSAGFETVVLDYDSRRLERLRHFGLKIFFGDATRPDLLEAAGIREADILVVAIGNREKVTELARHAVENYPNVHVICRATDRHHVYELWEVGCRDIIRHTFDSAVRTGRSALEALGIDESQAVQHTTLFVEQDKQSMREMAGLYRSDIPAHENPAYVERARELLRAEGELLLGKTQESDTTPADS